MPVIVRSTHRILVTVLLDFTLLLAFAILYCKNSLTEIFVCIGHHIHQLFSVADWSKFTSSFFRICKWIKSIYFSSKTIFGLYWLYLFNMGNICMEYPLNIGVFIFCQCLPNIDKKVFCTFIVDISKVKPLFLQYWHFAEYISTTLLIFNQYWYFIGRISDMQ